MRDRTAALAARVRDGVGLPPRTALPRYLAPLPESVENLGLALAWPVVLVNLVGTAFGFWYYGFHPFSDPAVTWQFAGEPASMWLFVPDSPVATLFIALAFASWKLGRTNDYLCALAFFGCWKLGLWTPVVLVAFADGFLASTPLPLYAFLVVSHLAMVAEGFVLHRISDFPVRAVAVAAAWYGLNDVLDYLVPVVGTPHHTLLPGQRLVAEGAGFTHPSPTHEIAAAAAVSLSLLATFLALATRAETLRLKLDEETGGA